MAATTFDYAPLIVSVEEYLKTYMSKYDGSHDYSHIRRVVNLAEKIYALEVSNNPNLDKNLITLSAYLHDVGDKKYLLPGQDPTTMVQDLLLSLSCPPSIASTVQTICLNVSYSSEIKNPNAVLALIKEIPELAVVQDADRLDAIGAVGIGRTFLFSGARGAVMQDSIDHFGDKLLRLESMMKTGAGRELAKVRSERLRTFREWWGDEVDEEGEKSAL